MEICPKCGLPQPACVCEQIVKSSQRIQVSTDKKRYGKIVTIVSGFDKEVNVKKNRKSYEKSACLRRNLQRSNNRTARKPYQENKRYLGQTWI